MDLPISTVLEHYLLSRLMEDRNLFLLIIWGSWIFWTLYNTGYVQSFRQYCARCFVLSHWIVIPLTLTALPEQAFIPEIMRYVIPIISFFLGDFSARRRSEEEKIKAYRKVLCSMNQEIIGNRNQLNRNLEILKEALSEIVQSKASGNEYQLIQETSLCESRFIEVFLNNAKASWSAGSLYTEVDQTNRQLIFINEAFAERAVICKRINSTQTKPKDRTDYLDQLFHNDQKLFGEDIPNLTNSLCELQSKISTTLEKESAQFLACIEF